jgi:methionyl-tRNA synthetase
VCGVRWGLVAKHRHDRRHGPANRAGGWGIPVPGDPDQVVHVWFDALAYYLTPSTAGGQDWWSRGTRQHLIGKGILRFHAVYWPAAILLSAGLPLPDAVLVHDYLTVDGAKISKSGPVSADPIGLVARYGSDAVRWWLTSEVPKLGDVDFAGARLVHRHDTDLAGGLGNLVNRTAAPNERNVDHQGEPAGFAEDILGVTEGKIDYALAEFDFRAATDAIRAAVPAGNRYAEYTRPWAADQPGTALATLTSVGNGLAGLVAPFLPSGAERLRARLAGSADPPFRRLHGW